MNRLFNFLNTVFIEFGFLFRDPVVWIIFPILFLTALFNDCGGV